MGELAVGVHAVNYIGGVKSWEGAHHLRSRGVWVCMARREDLWAGGLRGPSWAPTFPLQEWSGNRHDAGCRSCLAGAAASAFDRKRSKK